MNFSEESIEWLDNQVEIVRSRPDMYLRGEFNSADMAERLAGDALMLGALHVAIVRYAAWYVISADIDWLSSEPRAEPYEAFFQIVRLPEAEAGPHAMRSEILLTAFASKVVSASLDDRFIVKGNIEIDDAIWSKMCLSGTSRSIAFQDEDN